MIKQIKLGLLALISFLFLSGQALADPTNVTVTDCYQNDMNTIEAQISIGNDLVAVEYYKEKYLTSYKSHDGSAIVNNDGNYFDKIVTDYDIDLPLVLTFDVQNLSPYLWSDYHFEFWNEQFTERLEGIVTGWEPATIFQNSQYEGSVLEFWAPGWQGLGQYQMFTMDLDLPDGFKSFGIRQVATTAVPVPGALWLLGSGLIGLVGLRRKLKK